MPIERCEACGFDGSRLSDEQAIDQIGRLPERWAAAVDGVDDGQLGLRPIAQMWSIAEYVDHVREVLFGMRYVLDVAVDRPGTDLGDPPEPEFTAEPKQLDVQRALTGIETEAAALRDRLLALATDEWSADVVFGGAAHDARWICRHAVHDASHHLSDVDRLREAHRAIGPA